MTQRKSIGIGAARIADRILEVRGRRVILDSELATLYGVTTRQLNQAVRRNPGRFPAHFCFQLSNQEVAALRSQFVISKAGRGGRRYSPHVFTEHGATMAATILNTPRAIDVSVYVVSAFIELREALGTPRAEACVARPGDCQYSLGDTKPRDAAGGQAQANWIRISKRRLAHSDEP